MDSARHALVAVCVFGVLVGALGLYRNEHRLGSFIPAQTDTTGSFTTFDLGEGGNFLSEASSQMGTTLLQGEVLGASTTRPRLVESLTKTISGTEKRFSNLSDLFAKKEFIYADVLGIGGDYVASLTGSGLAVVKGKLTCREAEGRTMGCISGNDLDSLNDKLDENDINSSSKILSIVGDGTGTGSLVFNTNPSLTGLTVNGTSTMNGIAVTGGCVSVNGICLGTSTSTGSVGNGLAGQMAYYANDGSLVSGTSSLVVLSNGKIAIGTTSPHSGLAANLLIDGTTDGKANIRLWNGASTSNAYAELSANANNGAGAYLFAAGDNFNVFPAMAGRASVYSATGGLNLMGGSSLTADVRFFTGGLAASNERLRITSSGNIGIGTTSPSARLSVDTTNLGTSSAFVVGSSTATQFVVTNNGRVGIGTSNPGALLDVLGPKNTATLRLISSTNDTSWTDTDRYGAIQFNSLDASDGGPKTMAEIYALNNASYPFGGRSNLVFATADTGSSTERMRVTSAGNVGIGTTSPSQKLSVMGNGLFGSKDDIANYASGFGITNFVSVIGSNDLDKTGIVIGNRDGVNNRRAVMYLDASKPAVIFDSSISTGSTPNWAFLSGNVGIGTTTPTQNLTVQTNGAGQSVLSVGNHTTLAGQFLSQNFNALNHLGNPGAALSMSVGGSNATASGFAANNLAIVESLSQSGMSIGAYATGNLYFQTGTRQTRMTVTNSGNVGIGTTTPASALTISRDNNVVSTSIPTQIVVAGASNPNKQLWLGIDTTSNAGVLFASDRNSGSGYPLLLNPYSGNVGIGTTSPSGKLHVAGTAQALVQIQSSDTFSYLTLADSGSSVTTGQGIGSNGNDLILRANGGTRAVMTSAGSFGIGTTTPGSKLQVVDAGHTTFSVVTTGTGNIPALQVLTPGGTWSIDANRDGAEGLSFFRGSSGTKMLLTPSGSLGIGTTTPSAQLTTTGTVRFANFGAGTLQTDALGNLSVASDERLKDIEGEYTRGLEAILGIEPITYRWKSTTGYDTANLYTGFSAQNIKDFIPEAVGEDKHGFLSLSDRPILATIVNALKEMRRRIVTDELCVGATCINEDQLRELLESRNIEPIDPPPPAPPTDTDSSTAATSTDQIAETTDEAITETSPQSDAVASTTPMN